MLVCLVRTISRSGMMCAGLKKCAPTMRSWLRVLAPTSSMSMVEVLVARMQVGEQEASRSAKMRCLRPMSCRVASSKRQVKEGSRDQSAEGQREASTSCAA